MNKTKKNTVWDDQAVAVEWTGRSLEINAAADLAWIPPAQTLGLIDFLTGIRDEVAAAADSAAAADRPAAPPGSAARQAMDRRKVTDSPKDAPAVTLTPADRIIPAARITPADRVSIIRPTVGITGTGTTTGRIRGAGGRSAGFPSGSSPARWFGTLRGIGATGPITIHTV